MGIIKPLPEAVQSAVRSGFIIGGLTTIVEELIYNSLDAGATKVSVHVGVSNGYVKVEDDGSGINRDGLVLLGERYATSKLQFYDEDNSAGSFGFRGEVLCSIADISLIEIVTRVHGRPNGYRKVMKGRTCLYLSIDNDRQDVGTTVTVRDLFYNQPVRRRQMQSSAKKVLHSVKKCTVRIALMQPRVSFKVVDIESEDELLRTLASSSSLSVLCSNFGIEASSLHELSFSEGSLKLTGHLSGPSTSLLSKAIQYIYVNSRFVSKGAIHKVLNRLADLFWDQLSGEKRGKRGQPNIGPTYCLNLTCPRSSYNLNLEFSRTSVEFKDWASVLAFIEKSVASLWSKKATKRESYHCDADQTGNNVEEKVLGNMPSAQKDWLLKTCEISTKRRRTRITKHEQVSAISSPYYMEMQAEDGSDFSSWHDIDKRHRDLGRNTVRFGEPDKIREFHNEMDSFDSGGPFPSDYNFNLKDNNGNCLWEPNKDCMSFTEDLFENDVTTRKRDGKYQGDFLSSSKWMDEIRVGDANTRSTEVQTGWSFEVRQENSRNRDNNDHEIFSLPNRSWGNVVQTPFDYGKNTRFQIENFNARSCSNTIGSGDADGGLNQSDIFQRAQCHNDTESAWSLPKFNMQGDVWNDLDITVMKSRDSLSFKKGSIEMEHTPESLSKPIGVCSTFCLSADMDQHSSISYPFLSMKTWDLEELVPNRKLARVSKAGDFDGFEQCNDGKQDSYQHDLGDRRTYENFPSASCLNSSSLFRGDCSGVEKDICEFSPHGHSVGNLTHVRYGDSFSKETFSPCVNRRRTDHSCSPSVCWSPAVSINREVKMDLPRCQPFEAEHIAEESMGRNNRQCSPFSDRCGDMLADETFSPCLDVHRKSNNTHGLSVPCVSSISVDEDPNINLQRCQVSEPSCSFPEHFGKSCMRLRRSHSAPPNYRGKKRFLSVFSLYTAESSSLQTASQVYNVTERGKLEQPPASPLIWSERQHHETFPEDSQFIADRNLKGSSNITKFSPWSQDHMTETACCKPGYLRHDKDSDSSRIKWREGCPDTALKDIVNQKVENRVNQVEDENAILDICSCMLHLAGDSLVPKSINRSCLERAKVLLQVDNKFIPVVASGTLAVIDQHAADERIRLEDMRQKVISGEMKSITYLEEEKDLVLPEMAYQLLCNYSEQIQHWGWICNIFSQDCGSFAKNLNLVNAQTTHLTLLAVPCILGVNLSDADLLEFLEQLTDTDGSSTIPPSVLRVLNNKACRGAIMFGDKLLPSECSLIVEELKQTSLCFQCAHGRPTTVPLVNLEALHKGIQELRSWHEGSKDSWHGLCRKQINVTRARHRLDIARGCE